MRLHFLAEFAPAVPWLLPGCVFLLGAGVGRFLNGVISRVPGDVSLATSGAPGGRAPRTTWRENIPLLSWLLWRDRARASGQSSFRQPLVELLTGLLFLVCFAKFPPAVAACGAIFLSALVAAAFIDFDHFIIPDVLTIGLAIAGVILSLAVPALHAHHSGALLLDTLRAGFASVVGVMVGSAVVLWIGLIGETVLKKEAVGFGDVKFVGAIGAFCGWQGAVFALFGGSVVFVAWFGAAWLWTKISGRRAAFALPSETAEGESANPAFGLHIPFGPMLAIAGALHFLVFRSWFNGSFAELAFLGGRG